MQLDEIKQALLASYRSHGGINHLDGVNLPSQQSVNQLAADCMHLLFPGYFEESALSESELPTFVDRLLTQIDRRLLAEIEKCLRFAQVADAASKAREITTTFLAQFPELRAIIKTD